MATQKKQSSLTYEIVESGGQTGIKCLRCHLISYNPNDVANKYCGRCHMFHEEMKASKKHYRRVTFMISVVVEYNEEGHFFESSAGSKALVKFASDPTEFYYGDEWATKEEYLKDLW